MLLQGYTPHFLCWMSNPNNCFHPENATYNSLAVLLKNLLIILDMTEIPIEGEKNLLKYSDNYTSKQSTLNYTLNYKLYISCYLINISF